MRWIDVAGPPGVGKSTLLDPLWAPRSIVNDGKGYPREWHAFLDCVVRLLVRIHDHPSYAACLSMTNRSFAKMAAVSRMPGDRIYIQTGFAQRGLGIGWRLRDPEAIAEYFDLMPVSLGVVLLNADVALVQRRNVARGKDRSHMVPLMQRPLQIAGEVLQRRGVAHIQIDTSEPLAASARSLEQFRQSVSRKP